MTTSALVTLLLLSPLQGGSGTGSADAPPPADASAETADADTPAADAATADDATADDATADDATADDATGTDAAAEGHSAEDGARTSAPETEAPPAAEADQPTPPADAEGGSLEAALLSLMDKASDPVRVAVAPVKDTDADRAKVLGTRIARLLVSNTDVDVVTASRIEHALRAAAVAAVEDATPPQSEDLLKSSAFEAFAADHVVLGEVISAGGRAELQLRLLHVESGEVVAQTSVPVSGDASASSVEARTVRGALRLLAADLSSAMDQVPGDKHYQRLAVAPLKAEGAAVEASRIERFAQAELIRALADEGFLVVERERLDQAMAQFSIAANLDEANAPQIGKALDAQAIVVGSVAEAGETFVVNVRIISVDRGEVLGAATASLRRENTVSLANRAIETRTPADAFFRSAVAPGWGQFYNRQPIKGALLGTATFGAAAATVVLGVATGATWFLYQTAQPDMSVVGAQQSSSIEFARNVRDVTTFSTLGMGVVAGGLWSVTVTDALISALYAE